MGFERPGGELAQLSYGLVWVVGECFEPRCICCVLLRSTISLMAQQSTQGSRSVVCEYSHTGPIRRWWSGHSLLWACLGKVYLFCCLGSYGNTGLSAGKVNSRLKTIV